MKTDSTTRVFLILFAVLWLAACGGGSGGGSGGTDNTGGGSPPSGPWTRQLGTAMGDFATGIATDAAGNVYVAGYTNGGLDGNTNAGSIDLVVVKYAANSNKLWTRQLGTAMGDVAKGIATDANGSAYVAGYTGGGLDGNTSAGTTDFFVVKYDTNGNKLWTRQLGTTSSDQAYGIATDANGNVYVTGYTSGSLDGITFNAGFDFFVVKYDTNGNKLWTRQFGASQSAITDSQAHGIATDANSNVYVTGHTTAGLDGTSAGSYDLFVVKYDTDGIKLWTRQLGTATDDRATGIATDAVGNVYVTGHTDAGLDGNTYAGAYDLFVVKYDTNGNKLWTKQLGTAMDDVATGIAIAAGTVYVTGRTESGLDGNTHAGASDLFVVKFAAQGKPCSPIPVFPPCEVQPKLWTRQLGTTMVDIATGIATDAGGDAYVAGSTAGGLDGNTNAGFSDFFVVKYDANGTKQ